MQRGTVGTMAIAGSGLAVGSTGVTVEDWESMGEDEEGELVDGVLVEEEVSDVVHEVVATWLAAIIAAWLFPRGGTIGGAAKFMVSERRGRKPDAFVFLPGSRKPRARGASRRAPDIVIEVVSPGRRNVRRDRVEKLAEYAAFGVTWYWLVDPEARMLEIHERGADGRYVHAVGATGGRVDIPGCPGLTLDLDDLWRRVDELPADEDGAGDDDVDVG